MRLAGRVAVVTGATSGIGRAAAAGLAAEGASVVVAGRSAERGAAVVDDIRAAGGDARFVQTDVGRVADCERLVATAIEQLGRVDVLVNSAGVFPIAPVADVTEELFDSTFDVNVKGAYFCGRAALVHMAERGSGAVVNVSSVAGTLGFAGVSLYCASKGAIHTLTKSWAVEFAPRGVRVNAIAPGNVETPMNDHLMADPQYRAAMLAITPAGRNGVTADIVPAVVYLASDDSAYCNGAILTIDGGLSAT